VKREEGVAYPVSEEIDEAKRSAYRQGFNDGYRKGYDRGLEEGLEKAGKRTPSIADTVQFMKITCECGALNFHPVFNNRLIVNADEERRCGGCGRIVTRDEIFAYYSRLQSKNRS